MAPVALTLSQIATNYGISEQSLLLYEREGLISPLKIEEERFYSPKERVRIEIVLKGRKLGFSLFEIRQLMNAHMSPTRDIKDDGTNLTAEQTHKQIERLLFEIDDLQTAIARLRATIGKI